MKKIFYGAAIQGAKDRKERAHVHNIAMDAIKHSGFQIISEHTKGQDFDDTARLLDDSIGPLPPVGKERTIFVRQKMIEAVESEIQAAIFEVSNPSLGTGIEIAHAYLRPRMGLRTIPVIVLYQKDYWPNKLSSMINGITNNEIPHFHIVEYEIPDDLKTIIPDLLKTRFSL